MDLENHHLDMRVVFMNSNGEFHVNPNIHVVVCCSDHKCVEVPKNLVPACTFLVRDEGKPGMYRFDFPAVVLENLVHWTAQYGINGQATSALVKPCIYRDFDYVTTNSWDRTFYKHNLSSSMNEKYYLPTMNAAEKYGIQGLLDFMVVALGCRLRSGEDDSALLELLGLDANAHITQEDLDAVDTDYPWIAEATKPVPVK